MYLSPVCTNVNNYVIFVPHVPIYWSEGINEFEVEKKTCNDSVEFLVILDYGANKQLGWFHFMTQRTGTFVL